MRTGGPAFPWSPTFQHPNSDVQWTDDTNYGGMTLRDYFAGQALIALMGNADWARGLEKVVKAGSEASFKKSLALNAYNLADMMIEAREA